MNNKVFLMVIAIGGLLIVGNAAKTEYVRIQARIETTQTKVDALADELKATTTTIHNAIKSITDRFAKQLDDKAQQIEETFRSEVYRLETKPTIVEHKNESGEIKLIDPPNNNAPTQPRIVMHSGYSCGPCNAWIATEKAKWEKAGWQIEIVKEIESKRSWPWFEIYERDGTRFQVDGPLTTEKFIVAKKLKQP